MQVSVQDWELWPELCSEGKLGKPESVLSSCVCG